MSQRTAALLLLFVSMVGVAAAKQKLRPTPESTPVRETAPDWSRLCLWYRQPAKQWTEALPVGNGRLGAMVFGGAADERLQLNEETLWSGGPYDPTRAGASAALPEVRRLVFEGRFLEAHNLFGRTLMGMPVEQMKYQPLGNLVLTFPGHDQASDYRRQLDLDEAVARVSYRSGDTRFTRDVFVSPVDQVIVVRITADRPGAISFGVRLLGVRNDAHSNYGTDYFRMDAAPPDGLLLTGKSADYLGVQGRMRYECRVKVLNEGGRVGLAGSQLTVSGATAVTLLVAAATNFVSHDDVSGDPAGRVAAVLGPAAGKPYDALRQDHVAEHRRLFRRTSLEVGQSDHDALPTDARLKRVTEANDPGLAALFFQYGRYLLISSSRPRTQPANLQGIWNDSSNPWWDSKYTTNINAEMNYWPAEVANLADCHEPLIDMVRAVAAGPGARVAREHYGAGGWVLHQNTDIWLAAAPMDGPTWGTWTLGGAWLCTQIWEHYRFNPGVETLRHIYPAIKGATQFFLDTLVPHPAGQWLVTNPSNSPENFPAREDNERYFDEVSGIYLPGTTICAGPAMDMEILRELFAEFVEASETLGVDAGLRDRARDARRRLAPLHIGSRGNLQEWLEDWDDLEPEHRHVSHLWGLFPGREIDVERTPDLARAARVSLVRRGDAGLSFSMAWKAALWARLREGERAHHLLTRLLSDATFPNFFSKDGQALQVDGNLGATAAIAEMLLQTQDGALRLLPALPAAWARGRVTGLRARGGFEVDMAWADGRPTLVRVTSTHGGDCTVRSLVALRVRSGEKTTLPARSTAIPGGFELRMKTVAGQVVELEAGRDR